MPRQTTTVTVRDQSFVLERRLFEDMPDALAFMGHLLDRRVAPHTVKIYVTAVCRLKRRGQLADLRMTTNVNERTAANAYTKWRAETFFQRSQEVAHAVHGLPIKRVRFLRRHSLVAPAPGKMIPVRTMPGMPGSTELVPPDPDAPHLSLVGAPVISPSVTWQSAETLWTLHVPHDFVAPHSDPCESCEVFILDAAALEGLAVAFEKTWGNRDLNGLPPEAYLFGTPPAESDMEAARAAGEKALAIVSASSTRADDMEKIGVAVVLDVGAAIEQLRAVDGVYLSRAAIGGRLNEVLGAVWGAWSVKG